MIRSCPVSLFCIIFFPYRFVTTLFLFYHYYIYIFGNVYPSCLISSECLSLSSSVIHLQDVSYIRNDKKKRLFVLYAGFYCRFFGILLNSFGILVFVLDVAHFTIFPIAHVELGITREKMSKSGSFYLGKRLVKIVIKF